MAFCIAIEEELVVGTCPLRKGVCYWQHRTLKSCCYTAEELTEDQFIERVGAAEVDLAKRQNITDQIKNTLRGSPC